MIFFPLKHPLSCQSSHTLSVVKFDVQLAGRKINRHFTDNFLRIRLFRKVGRLFPSPSKKDIEGDKKMEELSMETCFPRCSW